MGDEGTLTIDAGVRKRSAAKPGAFLFVALTSHDPLAPPSRHALEGLDEIHLGRGPRGATRTGATLSLSIDDPRMSARHARLARTGASWRIEDAGSKNGSFVDGDRIAAAVTLRDGAVVELGHSFLVFHHDAAPPGAPLDADAGALAPVAPGLATLSPSRAAAFGVLPDVARSDLAVHVHGETGTGKELVARAIHALSGRTGAFVAVNCGAIPGSLVESELFGAKKGAFSGAVEDRPGLVRSAHEGTLFLDEVGDLPAPAQAALLRVLQEREVVPVGGTRAVRVDFRAVSATHHDLEGASSRGAFRADLLARLAGYHVRLAPLRERREDLGLIVGALVGRAAGRAAGDVAFTVEAARAIFRHRWSRNVRELEQAIRRACVLSRGAPIDVDHLFESPPDEAPDDDAEGDDADAARPLGPEDEARRAELEALLRAHAGNVSNVARAMGKARMQIQRWMKRYGLDPAAFR